MSMTSELTSDVADIFLTDWESRQGRIVPDAEDVSLGNDAVRLDGVVLYADLADSTGLVKSSSPSFAAEVYKSYLHCASKIISYYDGTITAFDGDRVMAVYLGTFKNTNAVRSGLAINHAVTKIINPQIATHYPNKNYVVRQAVGIDSGSLYVARTGIRGSNDLVWVGTAANYAARLCSLRNGNFATSISERVYTNMLDSVRMAGTKNMWEQRPWHEFDMTVYRSSFRWAVGAVEDD